MSDRENSHNRPKQINGISKHDKNESELDLNLEDETLAALLSASLLSPGAENFRELNQIAGEYSSLNNTIDELNRYLDRWDERYEQLRVHIQEAVRANDEEDREPADNEEECDQENEDSMEENEETNKEALSEHEQSRNEQSEARHDQNLNDDL